MRCCASAAPARVDVVRFFLPNVFGPSLIGLIVGALISLAVGFGITKLIWELRQLQTVMGYLPTRLAVSEQTFLIAAILIALVVGIVADLRPLGVCSHRPPEPARRMNHRADSCRSTVN